jgi:hypothetical protein
MEKGFLPYNDGFGNYWPFEGQYRNATAPQVGINTKPMGYSVAPTPSISDYPKKVQGFFANSSGTLKTPTEIFYLYNGFLPTANNTNSRCTKNYNSFIQIQQDISSISQDPFGMAARLTTVRNMMNAFYMECTALNAPVILGCTNPAASNYNPNATQENGSCFFETAPVVGCTNPAASNYNPNATQDDGSCTVPLPTPQPNWGIAPPIGMGGGMPVSGGSPLVEGDLSLYCSQVPDDPACTGAVSSAGVGSAKSINWLLIGGVAVAAYLGYKYFVKK